jgi:hypothetical protein
MEENDVALNMNQVSNYKMIVKMLRAVRNALR